MKKGLMISFVALATMLLFVSGVMAQEKAATTTTTTAPAPVKEQKIEKFSGVIEKVEQPANEVVVQYHKDKLAFSVTDKSKIMEGKKELTLNDLKKGMWASVKYEKEGNKLLAQSLSVTMPKVAKKEMTSQTKTEMAPAAQKEMSAPSQTKAPEPGSVKK
jgi:hypothetical protein